MFFDKKINEVCALNEVLMHAWEDRGGRRSKIMKID